MNRHIGWGGAALAIRRFSHEEVIDEVGPGAMPAWLEAARGRPEDEPVGGGIVTCQADITHVAVLFDCDAWTEPPAEGVCVVLPRPNGVLWATLSGLEGNAGRWRAPRPAEWFWSNRRRGYRVPMDQPTEVLLGRHKVAGRFHDVSTTGCRLRLPLAAEAVPSGTLLPVRLPFGSDLWAEGEIVRLVGEENGAVIVGVRWRELKAAVDQQLANFVFTREREALRRGDPRRRR